MVYLGQGRSISLVIASREVKNNEEQIETVNSQQFFATFFKMATQAVAGFARQRTSAQRHALRQVSILMPQRQCICRYHKSRLFSSSTKLYRQQPNYKDSFGTRLRKALAETKIKWYPIPVGLGIGFIGLAQLYRVNEREKTRQEQEWGG